MQSTGLDADSPDALVDALLQRDRPCAIVVDALEEAVEPTGIGGKLLRPVAADAASAGVRVLVGTRPGRQDELIDALGRDAVRFDLDHPPYLQRADLVEFVSNRLLAIEDPASGNPYRGRKQLAARVANAVADRAYPTFLVAQLTSKALIQADTVVDVEVPGWEHSFPTTVNDAMDDYLNRLVQDAETEQDRRARKRRLRELLTPLAFAEGDGLPLAVWSAAASGLASRTYELTELDWLLSIAADYLVEQTTADGDSVYRLYHDALADYLRPASANNELVMQRRLVTALLEMVPSWPDGISRDWADAHPYLITHLAAHAAAAGRLDKLIGDPGYLLAAEPGQLLSALSQLTDDVSPISRAYQLALPHLTSKAGVDRACYLQLAARYCGANQLADRIDHLGLHCPWSVPWAHRDTVSISPPVISNVDPVNAVALGELDRRTVAVSAGGDGTVRMWAVATGQKLGDPLIGHTGPVNAVAAGEVDRRQVAVSAGNDGTVRMWDLAAGQQLGDPLIGHTGPVNAVAVGELLVGEADPRLVAVSAGNDGTVRVWDLAAGQQLGDPLVGHIGWVNAVAVGEVDRRLVAVSAGNDGTMHIWDLAAGQQLREPVTGSIGTVNAIAAGGLHGRRVAVFAGNDGAIHMRDLAAGQQLGEPLAGRAGTVNAIAAGDLDGRPVVVSASRDGTVRVWDLAAGQQLGELLAGGAAPVNAIAAGDLDGRPVAVSAGRDGILWVWDLAACRRLDPPITARAGRV